VKSVALVSKGAKSSLAAAAKKARPLRKRLTKAGAVLGRATTRATGLVKKNPVRAALGAAAVVLALAKLRRSV
jgi:hypothetical protein